MTSLPCHVMTWVSWFMFDDMVHDYSVYVCIHPTKVCMLSIHVGSSASPVLSLISDLSYWKRTCASSSVSRTACSREGQMLCQQRFGEAKEDGWRGWRRGSGGRRRTAERSWTHRRRTTERSWTHRRRIGTSAGRVFGGVKEDDGEDKGGRWTARRRIKDTVLYPLRRPPLTRTTEDGGEDKGSELFYLWLRTCDSS